MLKVNFSYLKYVDEKYYYEDKLFTGASFKIIGCSVEEFWEFKEGIHIGNYQSKYLPNDPSLLRINVDCIEFNGEYLTSYAYYQNHGFSGIAYEIEAGDELCIGEHLISDGWPKSSVGWDYLGNLRSVRLDSGDFSQNFSWYSDGSLRGLQLYSNEFQQRMIHVHLNEKKEFISIWIEKGYYSWVSKFIDRLAFDYFSTKEDFIDFAVSSSLGLYSSGVDDDLFDLLMSNNKLATLSEITIRLTSLSEQSFLELAGLENLKTILIEDKRDLRGVAQQLKHERPDGLVKLNSEEVKN